MRREQQAFCFRLCCPLPLLRPNPQEQLLYCEAQPHIGVGCSRNHWSRDRSDEGSTSLNMRRQPKDTCVVKATEINQVYQAGFSKLPIAGHRMHLVFAVLDSFSRYVLVLHVSAAATTQAAIYGLNQALLEARRVSGFERNRTVALLTDAGPNFKSSEFLDYLSGTPFKHVPSTNRPFQSLGMLRRLAWTLQDEEFSLHEYADPVDAQLSLERFRYTYNFTRPHQALRYRVPADVFCKNQIRNPSLSSQRVQ